MTVSLFVFCCTVFAATTPSIAQEKRSWLSPLERNHPLVGKIWSFKARKFVSRDQLESKLHGIDFALLGEIHTNPDHHKLQAEFISVLAKSSTQKPAIVFEMVPRRLQSALTAFDKGTPDTAAELGDALEWDKRGWPAWKIYQPIAETAQTLKLKLFAGDLDRKRIRAIGRKGISAVSDAERQNLFLDQPYNPAQTELLDDILFESHCKLMPKSMLAPMRLVQQSRDGALARALVDAATSGPAVLIAGNGHIRKDIAVPRLLKVARPNARVLAIAFVEVVSGQNDAREYNPDGADKPPAYDYLYFTPRAEDKDHCAELAKRFKAHKKKN